MDYETEQFENIWKACDGAQMMLSDLREAHRTADPVLAIVLPQEIQCVAELFNRLKALRDAADAKYIGNEE